jgi:hypothetical protein
VCEDQRKSSNVAKAVRWAISHGVTKSNMSNPNKFLSIIVMVLLVVAVVIRRKDNILWQLLPMHVRSTLLIPMPSSSPCCYCCSYQKLKICSVDVNRLLVASNHPFANSYDQMYLPPSSSFEIQSPTPSFKTICSVCANVLRKDLCWCLNYICQSPCVHKFLLIFFSHNKG